MTVLNRKPNPLHHNYGRSQHPKTRFTAKINWFLLQVTGAQANMAHSGSAITSDPMFKELTKDAQMKLTTAINEARNTATVLKDVAEEIRSINGPQKWKESKSTEGT